jgi:parvulin-like peptidyl-prolyl isomerase
MRLRRLLSEPLVHFLLIGAVLFAGMSLLKAAHRPVVTIAAADLEQLAGYWELQTGRRPTKAELQGIIGERIDEELLAREALRLGLDKDDMIIRRRLAQKVAFASEDTTAIPEPSDADLRAWFARHRAAYASPGHIALRHVFFSGDRPAAEAQGAALKALHSLEESEATAVGDPFLLPLTYADVSPRDLGRDYGTAFMRAAETAPVGRWVGPVPSAYGLHILKVESRRPPEPAAFETVRDLVGDDYLAERRKAANAQFLAGLRKRYRVVVEGAAP